VSIILYKIVKHNYVFVSFFFSVGVTQCYSGCIRHVDFNRYRSQMIHHSQSSIKKYIFDIVKYSEEKEFARREDCVFCHRVFGIPNIKNVYISNPLSLYKPSGTKF